MNLNNLLPDTLIVSYKHNGYRHNWGKIGEKLIIMLCILLQCNRKKILEIAKIDIPIKNKSSLGCATRKAIVATKKAYEFRQ